MSCVPNIVRNAAVRRSRSAAENSFGICVIGTPENALLHIVDDVGVELRQHLLHEYARLHDAGLHAFAHVHDGLVEDRRRLRRALQPVVVVLDGRERLRARAGAELREVVGDVLELVDGQQPVGKLEVLESRFAIEREDVVRETVLAGEAFGADGARAIEILLLERARLLLELGRQEIRQLGVVARVAGERGGDRVELEVLFPELRVQRVQLRGAVVGGLRGDCAADEEERDEEPRRDMRTRVSSTNYSRKEKPAPSLKKGRVSRWLGD